MNTNTVEKEKVLQAYYKLVRTDDNKENRHLYIAARGMADRHKPIAVASGEEGEAISPADACEIIYAVSNLISKSHRHQWDVLAKEE